MHLLPRKNVLFQHMRMASVELREKQNIYMYKKMKITFGYLFRLANNRTSQALLNDNFSKLPTYNMKHKFTHMQIFVPRFNNCINGMYLGKNYFYLGTNIYTYSNYLYIGTNDLKIGINHSKIGINNFYLGTNDLYLGTHTTYPQMIWK